MTGLCALSECAPAFGPAQAEAGDVRGADGLLLCGRCGQRKERRISVEGFPAMTVPVMCACEAAAFDERRRQKEALARQERIARLREAGLAEPGYARCTFALDDGRNPALTAKAKRYVAHFGDARRENLGLMIYGAVGSGKTFLAGCIANALLEEGVSVWMTSLSRLVSAAGADFGDRREEVLERVAGVSLLILDDFGAERQTEYMNEQVYEIVNTRYKAGLPLIVTTNLDCAALTRCDELARKRIYDRVSEMCLRFRFTGADRRPDISAKKSTLARRVLADG